MLPKIEDRARSLEINGLDTEKAKLKNKARKQLWDSILEEYEKEASKGNVADCEELRIDDLETYVKQKPGNRLRALPQLDQAKLQLACNALATETNQIILEDVQKQNEKKRKGKQEMSRCNKIVKRKISYVKKAAKPKSSDKVITVSHIGKRKKKETKQSPNSLNQPGQNDEAENNNIITEIQFEDNKYSKHNCKLKLNNFNNIKNVPVSVQSDGRTFKSLLVLKREGKSGIDSVKHSIPIQLHHKLKNHGKINHINFKNLMKSSVKKSNHDNKIEFSKQIYQVCEQAKASHKLNDYQIREPKHRDMDNKIRSVMNNHTEVRPLIVLHRRKEKYPEQSSNKIIVNDNQYSTSFEPISKKLIHHKDLKLKKKVEIANKPNKENAEVIMQDNYFSEKIRPQSNCKKQDILQNNISDQIGERPKDRSKRKRDKNLVCKTSVAQLEAKMKKKRCPLKKIIIKEMSKQDLKLDKPHLNNDFLNSFKCKQIKDYEDCPVFANQSQLNKLLTYCNDPNKFQLPKEAVPKDIKTNMIRAAKNFENVTIENASIINTSKHIPSEKLTLRKREKKHKHSIRPVATVPFSNNKSPEQRKQREEGERIIEKTKNIGDGSIKYIKGFETVDTHCKGDLIKEDLFDDILLNSFLRKKVKDSKVNNILREKLSAIFSETITIEPKNKELSHIKLSEKLFSETSTMLISPEGQSTVEETVPNKLHGKEFRNRSLAEPSTSQSHEPRDKCTFPVVKENNISEEQRESNKQKNINKKKKQRLTSKNGHNSLQKDQLMLFYVNKELSSVAKNSLNIAISSDSQICKNGSSSNVLNVVIKQRKKSFSNIKHTSAASGEEKQVSEKHIVSTQRCFKAENTQDLQKSVNINENCLDKTVRKDMYCQTDEIITKYKSKRRYRSVVTIKNIHDKTLTFDCGQLKRTMEGELSQLYLPKESNFGIDEVKTKGADISLLSTCKQNSNESPRCQNLQSHDFKNRTSLIHIDKNDLDHKNGPLCTELEEKGIKKRSFYTIINDEKRAKMSKEWLTCNLEESVPVINLKSDSKMLNDCKIENDEDLNSLKSPIDVCDTDDVCIELKLKDLGLQRKGQFVRIIKSNSNIDFTHSILKNYQNTSEMSNNGEEFEHITIQTQNNLKRNSENHDFLQQSENYPKIIQPNQDDSKTKSVFNGCTKVDTSLKTDILNKTDLSSKNTFKIQKHPKACGNLINTGYNKEKMKQLITDPYKYNKDGTSVKFTKNVICSKTQTNYMFSSGPLIAKSFVVSEIGVQTDFIELSPEVNICDFVGKDVRFSTESHIAKDPMKSFLCGDDKTKLPFSRKSFVRIINEDDIKNRDGSFIVSKHIHSKYETKNNTNITSQDIVSEDNEEQKNPKMLQVDHCEILTKEHQIIHKIDAIYIFLQYLGKLLKENASLRLDRENESICTLGQINDTLHCLCSNCYEVLTKIESGKSREKFDNAKNDKFLEQLLFLSPKYLSHKKRNQFVNINEAVSLNEKRKQFNDEQSKVEKTNDYVMSNRFLVHSSKQKSELQKNCDDSMNLSWLYSSNINTNQFVNKKEYPRTIPNNEGQDELPNNIKKSVFMNEIDNDSLRKKQFNQIINNNQNHKFGQGVSKIDSLKDKSILQIDNEKTLLYGWTPPSEKRQKCVNMVNKDIISRSIENFRELKLSNLNDDKKSNAHPTNYTQNNMYLEGGREPFFVILPSNENRSVEIKTQNNNNNQKKLNFVEPEFETLKVMHTSKCNIDDDYFDTLLMKRKIHNCCNEEALWKEKYDELEELDLLKSTEENCCYNPNKMTGGKQKIHKSKIINDCATGKNTIDKSLKITKQPPRINIRSKKIPFSESPYHLKKSNMSAWNKSRLESHLEPDIYDSEIFNSPSNSCFEASNLPYCCVCFTDEDNSNCAFQNSSRKYEENVDGYRCDLFSSQWRESRYIDCSLKNNKTHFKNSLAPQHRLQLKGKCVKSSSSTHEIDIDSDNIMETLSSVIKESRIVDYDVGNQSQEDPLNDSNELLASLEDKAKDFGVKNVPSKKCTNILNNFWNNWSNPKLSSQDCKNTNSCHTYKDCIKYKKIGLNSTLHDRYHDKDSVSNRSTLFKELKRTKTLPCVPCKQQPDSFRTGSKSSIVYDIYSTSLNKSTIFTNNKFGFLNKTSIKDNCDNSGVRKIRNCLPTLNYSKNVENTDTLDSHNVPHIDNKSICLTQNKVIQSSNGKDTIKQKSIVTMKELKPEDSFCCVHFPNTSSSSEEENIYPGIMREPKCIDNNRNNLNNVQTEAQDAFLVSNESLKDTTNEFQDANGWISLSKYNLRNDEFQNTEVAELEDKKIRLEMDIQRSDVMKVQFFCRQPASNCNENEINSD